MKNKNLLMATGVAGIIGTVGVTALTMVMCSKYNKKEREGQLSEEESNKSWVKVKVTGTVGVILAGAAILAGAGLTVNESNEDAIEPNDIVELEDEWTKAVQDIDFSDGSENENLETETEIDEI